MKNDEETVRRLRMRATSMSAAEGELLLWAADTIEAHAGLLRHNRNAIEAQQESIRQLEATVQRYSRRLPNVSLPLPDVDREALASYAENTRDRHAWMQFVAAFVARGEDVDSACFRADDMVKRLNERYPHRKLRRP